MREFTRTLEAGQQDRIAAGGDYVYFKSGEGEIKLITDSGNDVILQVGQGVRFDKKFNTIDTQNINSEKSTFVIMIGLGDFQNNRMAGKVEIGGVVEVKQTEIVEVKPTGGSVAVGAKTIGGLLPVKTGVQIPARENREKLLINYFNNRPHSEEGLISVFFIVVKVDGVPLTFYAPYGKSGSIEINTKKSIQVNFYDNNLNGNFKNSESIISDNDNGEYNNNGKIYLSSNSKDYAHFNDNKLNYHSGNNNYTGADMLLSIVEVLNDAAEP